MEITEQHISHRWKFLTGAVIISAISAVDDFLKADSANSGAAVGSLIYAVPSGLLLGYCVWWIWAKTKKYDS